MRKMPLVSRDYTKRILQRAGLFPIVRSVYRSLNDRIRKQKAHEITFYRTLLRPDALCFDVGANLGQKAEVLLACSSRVIIVEPNILCLPTLRYLFGSNPNAEIVTSAVGNFRGSINLHVHGTDPTASVRPEWDRQFMGATGSLIR